MINNLAVVFCTLKVSPGLNSNPIKKKKRVKYAMNSNTTVGHPIRSCSYEQRSGSSRVHGPFGTGWAECHDPDHPIYKKKTPLYGREIRPSHDGITLTRGISHLNASRYGRILSF